VGREEAGEPERFQVSFFVLLSGRKLCSIPFQEGPRKTSQMCRLAARPSENTIAVIRLYFAVMLFKSQALHMRDDACMAPPEL